MGTIHKSAPVLETERTLLRPHRLEDFDAYCAMGTDPAVFRFIGGRARTREETWQRLLRHPGMWSLIGFGFWAIEDRASGRFIGEAGFHDLKRAIEPSIEGLPEAGWSLTSDMHGKGLGGEVLRRMLEWVDKDLRAPRTVCIIDPENAPSLGVARKCGYREYARTTYHDEPTILLERTNGT
ncbi:MAG: GNAT family N-acetyltransferase [Mesorhizobium sp.]